jgi:hypothetical protein
MVVMYLSTCLPEVVLLRLVCTALQRLVWNAGKRSGLQWEPISGSWFSPPVRLLPEKGQLRSALPPVWMTRLHGQNGRGNAAYPRCCSCATQFQCPRTQETVREWEVESGRGERCTPPD